MATITEYLNYTKQWKNEYGEKTIVLMQVGSFFEVYALITPDGNYKGSNIEEFAKINDMAIANKNICVGKNPVVMAGFGLAQIDKYVQKLQENEYTIVIYKQYMVGKEIKRDKVTEIISPGCYFPEESVELSNNVMCIWLIKSNATKYSNCQLTIGVSNIDIYTGKTFLFQFEIDYNHNPTTYDELERYIAAYRPSECLFVFNIEERLVEEVIDFVGLGNAKMHKINMNNMHESELHKFTKNAEKQNYQMTIFNKIYPDNPDMIMFTDAFPTHYVAIQSFCLLLDFVVQHNASLAVKITKPVFENYHDRLLLANHSLYQLNIIDDSRHKGRLRSVSSFLNHCMTTMGKRKFMYHLHNPITKKGELQSSYDTTEHMLNQGEERWQNIRTNLSNINDLEKFSRKLMACKLMPKHLSIFAENLMRINELYLKNKDDLPLVDYLPKEPIQVYCREIHADLDRVFSLEECRNVSDINGTIHFIKKGVSATVDELRKTSMDSREKLEALRVYFSDLIQQMEKGPSSLLESNNINSSNSKKTQYVRIHEPTRSDALLMGTSRRMTILKSVLKQKKENIVTLNYRSKFNDTLETFAINLSSIDFVTNGSNKKDLVITNSWIRSITNENQQAEESLVKEMQNVFQNYIMEFSKFNKNIQDIIHYTTELDLVQCKCYIAYKYNYCKPSIAENSMNEKSFFSATGIRHPLIEHLQQNELYVSNDLTLSKEKGNNKKGEGEGEGEDEDEDASNSNGLLLYGTNAVGKTSFIKSVGISIVMAQAGLYVPCVSFIYSPYQSIFTRILGNDNLFKGLSTFAVEMSELRTILRMADKNSLILGDELCSGTESDSALSIFTAGLEMLHAKESTFLFATHFHEIKKYSEIQNLTKMRMMHMAVQYNRETKTLIYDRKLREGPGESMYGLEVCKSLNLPDDFLKRAHDIRMKYQPEHKNILSLSTSHFNRQKIVGKCELCRKSKASEVHHLQHQKNANKDNNYINTFHKNHLANLINICDECHTQIHKSGDQHKITKTSNGYILEVIK